MNDKHHSFLVLSQKEIGPQTNKKGSKSGPEQQLENQLHIHHIIEVFCLFACLFVRQYFLLGNYHPVFSLCN